MGIVCGMDSSMAVFLRGASHSEHKGYEKFDLNKNRLKTIRYRRSEIIMKRENEKELIFIHLNIPGLME